jgi:uncharacterized protein with von Willebrand factor type A (vWA) domain
MRVRNLDEHGCRMLQCARVHHFETFLHSTRHTHMTQHMSVRTHACMLQRAHVQYICTHPHTRTSYDYRSLRHKLALW